MRTFQKYIVGLWKEVPRFFFPKVSVYPFSKTFIYDIMIHYLKNIIFPQENFIK